jgi:serine protease inhibitor
MYVTKPMAGIEPQFKKSTSLSNECLNDKVKEAINHFGLELYRQFSEVRTPKHQNFFFFTPNLIALFSMICSGAPTGKDHAGTLSRMKEELAQFLHGNKIDEYDWLKAIDSWAQGLQMRAGEGASKVYTYMQSNGLFKYTYTEFNPNFSERLALLKPEMQGYANWEEGKIKANRWIEQKTQGMIKDLVKDNKESEPPDWQTRLLMVSTALFKGIWKAPFDPKKNSKEDFYNSDGTKVSIAMMNLEIDGLRMAYDKMDENFSVQILELPFEGGITLLLAKPVSWGWGNHDVAQKADQLRKWIVPENVDKLFNDYDNRFKARDAWTIGVPLMDINEETDLLEELSTTHPIYKHIKTANFYGSMVSQPGKDFINGVPNPGYIIEMPSAVQMKLYEEGASIGAAAYSPTNYESCDPEFKANEPFGMILLDRTSQTVLAMGQINTMKGK